MTAKELATSIASELGLPDTASNEDVFDAVLKLKSAPVAVSSSSPEVSPWEARVSAKVIECVHAINREQAADILRQQDAAAEAAKKSEKTK